MTKTQLETAIPDKTLKELSAALEGGEVDLGLQVRQLRKARGLTIVDLAKKTELSIGHLSQLERNISKCTIDTLVTIADALDVSMHWFFSGAEADRSNQDIVVRASDRRRFKYPKLGIKEELLSPSLSSPIEFLHSVIGPGAASGEKSYRHKGYETGILLSGYLYLWVDEVLYELSPGDSFGFSSSRLHRFSNPTDEDAIVIWAMTPPTF